MNTNSIADNWSPNDLEFVSGLKPRYEPAPADVAHGEADELEAVEEA